MKEPVYTIRKFRGSLAEPDIYVNRLPAHLKTHAFVNSAHKHDFYLVVLITQGSGFHEIDFNRYTVSKGKIFLMQPGQMHQWTLSEDIDGYVFFHSRNIFEDSFSGKSIQELPYFRSIQATPQLQIKETKLQPLILYFESLIKEYKVTAPYQTEMLRGLILLIYLYVARFYRSQTIVSNDRYLTSLNKFEELIEKHYKDEKSPQYYADRLAVSEKHLNRIVRSCLNKTSTQLISERIALEAKRLLLADGQSVTEVAYELNFQDLSYFSRFFKKMSGMTPREFIISYRSAY